MIVHKCDICGSELGVWIKVATSIEATYDGTNVSNLLNLLGNYDICTDCAAKLVDFKDQLKRRLNE